MAAYLPVGGGGIAGPPSGSKDEIRTQFATREGFYRLVALPDYSRSSRVPLGSSYNVPVRLSFVTITHPFSLQTDDLMCFNISKELLVFKRSHLEKSNEIVRPLEKKFYQGTFPTCHDFNQHTANPDKIPLLVGFTNGQIHLIDVMQKEFKKSFNVDQLIDKTKVTCVRWIPSTESEFAVTHSSGQLYVYDESQPCVTAPPVYQLHKQGLGFSVHACKTNKSGPRNPKYRWSFDGSLCVNEFAFSPCARYLAVVSQDGFLRVFNYRHQEVMGAMKSYFGGLRCVCWSPDSKYVVTGGEDDLVTVWSLAEKRVICRYVGHKSWVGVVAFDPFTTVLSGGGGTGPETNSPASDGGDAGSGGGRERVGGTSRHDGGLVSYRFASVGEDTQLCLWELTEDNLLNQTVRNRTSGAAPPNHLADKLATTTTTTTLASNGLATTTTIPGFETDPKPGATTTSKPGAPGVASLLTSSSESSGLSTKFGSLSISEQHHQTTKEAKRSYSTLGSSRPSGGDSKLASGRQQVSTARAAEEALRLLGVTACPQLHEVPMLDPLVCKRIAHERLTALAFREDSVVTACQEGMISTWARPGTLNNGYL